MRAVILLAIGIALVIVRLSVLGDSTSMLAVAVGVTGYFVIGFAIGMLVGLIRIRR